MHGIFIAGPKEQNDSNGLNGGGKATGPQQSLRPNLLIQMVGIFGSNPD
jgi:hypothetical protein